MQPRAAPLHLQRACSPKGGSDSWKRICSQKGRDKGGVGGDGRTSVVVIELTN